VAVESLADTGGEVVPLTCVEQPLCGKIAFSASSRVRQDRRYTSSIFNVEKKFSIKALSYESPTEPIDGTMPLSDKRFANRNDV
jgi:hypothetical protein